MPGLDLQIVPETRAEGETGTAAGSATSGGTGSLSSGTGAGSSTADGADSLGSIVGRGSGTGAVVSPRTWDARNATDKKVLRTIDRREMRRDATLGLIILFIEPW